jgi:SEC-C motif domain protein
MKSSPNDPCPCGRGDKYKRCCRLYHEGRLAPDAEALMRSRFTAYALDLPRYIRETTHPDGPHWQEDPVAWDRDIRSFTNGTAFRHLEIREHVPGDTSATVSFVVTLEREGKKASFGEQSNFLKVDGRWLYHSGKSFKP